MNVLKKPWVAGVISVSVVVLSIIYLFLSSTTGNVEASTSRERRERRDRPNVSQNVGSQERDDHALIGTWDNGSGRIFLFVFNEADSVEFRANGTVVITEGRSSRTVNWSSSGPGAFTADGQNFAYSIRGNILTITDSWDDSWTFDRVR